MLNEKTFGIKFSSPIDDVHWKTQDSTLSSLLFYKITDEKVFADRITNAQFAHLIVNRAHPDLPENSTIIPEDKWPEIQRLCLDDLYPLPPIKLIALTGTNGKTTTTDLVLQIGELMGKKGISVGTLGVRENHKTILDFGLTSPSLIDLRKFIFTYGKDKDFCVLEASSHALAQGRLQGLKFEAAGWLSFSQDHLDYHQTMELYFESKFLILNHLSPGALLYVPAEQKKLFDDLAIRSTLVRKATEINEALPVFFQARFNQNNLEVAVSVLEHTFKTKVPKCWDKILPPDGRFYIRPYGPNYIVVDFAHTPDALENICKGIRSAFPNHTLKVLFGCGGDRDRTKRPKMAEAASAYAQKLYLTSDNPRSEDPALIIEDIAKGVMIKDVVKIVERPEAVRRAFSELTDNEVLLLAGKGHEDYILIKGVKHPYSDIQEVEKFIARKKQ
jgi:UDP-N-acetylmuramoyl-L-alanyl-D-glutamate--2,6-diaminopimelate ligase